MFVSPIVAHHWIRATEAELADLNKIRDECGDDLPDDFDVNDIPIYEFGLNFLRRAEKHGATWDSSNSKYCSFMIALLAKYARQHVATLTESEYHEIFKAYCELRLEFALDAIAGIQKYCEPSSLVSTCKYYAHSALISIEQFPDKS